MATCRQVTPAQMERRRRIHFYREWRGCSWKEWDIYSTLQTNGFFDWEEFQEKIFSWIDLILFDVKLSDARNHLEYTYQDNLHIQANLARLVQAKPSSILPRIPLNPKFIATPENLQALLDWFQAIGVKQNSLLPYNPAWAHKAESIGKKMNPRLPTQMLTPTELERWRQLFMEHHLGVSEYPLGRWPNLIHHLYSNRFLRLRTDTVVTRFCW